MEENRLPEEETDYKGEALIKKDRSLLYMLLILLGIILVMGYLTLFVDNPWKIFSKKEEVPLTVTNDRSKILDKNVSMSDEEIRRSLVKFIEAFYHDQRRGYFDPPSYFAPITETFYNYHNLTFQRLKDIYWKRREDRQNLHRNWIVSSLDFERDGQRIIATYWTKESYFRPSLHEQQSMDIKYEMIINEEGKIVSLKELEIKNFDRYKVMPDSTVLTDSARKSDAAADEQADSQIYDYSVVDVQPVFASGQKEWTKFVTSNLKYPARARDNNIEGKVMVAFIVSKDGVIRDVKVRQGIGYGCDEEAVRLIKSSPPWKPGMVKGNPVNTYCVLPVSFQLR